jgi:hypothetical protein
MDTTLLLIIIIVLLIVGGGGWYGRGRWSRNAFGAANFGCYPARAMLARWSSHGSSIA